MMTLRRMSKWLRMTPQTCHGEIINDDQPRHGDTANDPVIKENEASESDGYMEECAEEELSRWKKAYEKVCEERSQRRWMELKMMWSSQVTADVRGYVVQRVIPRVRRREIVRRESDSASIRELEQWHRFMNSSLVQVLEIHMSMREKERQIKMLQRPLVVQQDQAPNATAMDVKEWVAKRFEMGELADKSQQTGLTYDHHDDTMKRLAKPTTWSLVACQLLRRSNVKDKNA